MKEVINIYKRHKLSIDNYITTLVASLPPDYIANAQSILSSHRYIQLIYKVDGEYRQISPVVCRRRSEEAHIHSDKSHYFAKLKLNDEGIYISNPYIHYRTGKASISVVVYRDGVYNVFDIHLIALLEELRLIEYNSFHDRFKKSVYALGSILLAIVAILLLLYGGYKLLVLFMQDETNFLHDVFKSIIAITLGLAIYDLAKQIFEHEVIFNSFHHAEDKEYKVLGKFLISIVIALSIETLMVVFKIALDDYSKMLSAFYLLLGTTIMFVGLAFFYKTIMGNKPEED